MKRQTAKSLSGIQNRFLRALVSPLTPQFRTPRSASVRPALRDLAPNSRLDARERFELYHRQYWFRVWDCFYEDFPGLRAMLGEKKFDALSNAYLLRHPSRSFTLRNLGDRLADFIRRHPRLTAPRTLLALGIVRVEWAQIEAFDRAEFPALDLSSLPPERLLRTKIFLQPHVQLLALDHPVDRMLLHFKRREEFRGAASNAVSDSRHRIRSRTFRILPARPTWLAVHRHDFQVYYKNLTPPAFRILQKFQKGSTLAAAISDPVLSKKFKVTPGQIQDWFADWSSLGWLTTHSQKQAH
ncbi:MAG: DNA-binding domain-containing protein [Verrucomicrobiae bacterium]|nr:DNA-binding domain-containing protein [Verrucomicrobiae bacterium]